MTSRSRRQTRSRRFGQGVWAPYEHNETVARRKELHRISKAAAAAAGELTALVGGLGLLGVAAANAAASAASLAASFSTGGFTSAWTIREKTELERTIAHADILGMDEDDAARMIEDFRLTRTASPSSPGGIRAWEDLRDEITDHVLGFGAARLIS